MSRLNKDSSFEEIEKFLLFYIDDADGRKSRINPVLTKQQVWDINMKCVISKSIRVKNIIIKNITREFGHEYGD